MFSSEILIICYEFFKYNIFKVVKTDLDFDFANEFWKRRFPGVGLSDDFHTLAFRLDLVI